VGLLGCAEVPGFVAICKIGQKPKQLEASVSHLCKQGITQKLD